MSVLGPYAGRMRRVELPQQNAGLRGLRCGPPGVWRGAPQGTGGGAETEESPQDVASWETVIREVSGQFFMMGSPVSSAPAKVRFESYGVRVLTASKRYPGEFTWVRDSWIAWNDIIRLTRSRKSVSIESSGHRNVSFHTDDPDTFVEQLRLALRTFAPREEQAIEWKSKG